MDHYGYTTRPLVEYNLDLYTERASFLGWLGHMSERRRLAITLDPAASEPSRFKNKRVQVSGIIGRGESEPEVSLVEPPPSIEPSSSTKPSPGSHSPVKTPKQKQVSKSRSSKRRKEADSEGEYIPPVKVGKTKSKRGSLRSSKAPLVKANTSAFGNITDDGGKRPKYLHGRKQEASDSDTSLKDNNAEKESHSDSFTDS